MNEVLNWLLENSVTILIVIVAVAGLVFAIINNKEGLLYKAALYAVSVAEETWGSKTGQIKFAEVYTYLKTQFPIITFFISEKALKTLIEDALTEMKRILAEAEVAKQKKEQIEE